MYQTNDFTSTFVEEAEQLVRIVLVGVGPEVDPAVACRVVLANPVAGAILERGQETARRHVGGKARLREDRDVRGRACFGIDNDLLLETVRAHIGNVMAGLFGEDIQNILDQLLVRPQPGAENGQLLRMRHAGAKDQGRDAQVKR
ncbi:hypothetical protein KU6B_30000 [Mameliella alba]|nr:hypothetical protein KU6B_30000 [Mameliella alba]